MYQQAFIFLLGTLLFVVATQSARLPYNNNDELNVVKYQRQPITRGFMDDDHFIRKLVKPIPRSNVINRNQTLKLNKKDFNAQQNQFQQEMLQAHNDHRAHHCVPPLQIDDNLGSSAQQYAEHLVIIDRLEHSGTPGVGENLWMMGSSGPIDDISGNQPTDDWYSEIDQYDFNHGDFSPSTGHFTQVVWKNTQNLGAGVAYNDDRTKVYVVAQYTPPGNYLGEFQDNVFPATC